MAGASVPAGRRAAVNEPSWSRASARAGGGVGRPAGAAVGLGGTDGVAIEAGVAAAAAPPAVASGVAVAASVGVGIEVGAEASGKDDRTTPPEPAAARAPPY